MLDLQHPSASWYRGDSAISKGATLRIVRLRRRARIIDGKDVLSEVLDHPGPTNTMFDLLAACIAALSPGERVAMLGFAAGGVIAPLRAMGFASRIESVDINPMGEELFREFSAGWAGSVHVSQGDAVGWLHRRRKPFDLILEDLSTPSTEEQDGVKPYASLETLPHLMKARLRARGIAVTNVLPMPGMTWDSLLGTLAAPFAEAVVVHVRDYYNKILITGRDIGTPRSVSIRLRNALRSIRSSQAERISVRKLERRQHPNRNLEPGADCGARRHS